MSHKYRLLYRFDPKPEGVTREEVAAAGAGGACDAALVASIIYPEDGSLSVLFTGTDGRTGDMISDVEMFKVWTLLANRLAASKTLGEGKRQLAQLTWDAVCSAIRSQDVRN